MIEVVARVERADDQHIWLQRNDGSQCQRCQQGNGCGGAIWGKLLSANTLLKLPNHVHAQSGNRLRLTISESRFLRISVIAYLLPLLWIISAAGLGHYWRGEISAIFAAIVAIAIWLVIARGLVVSFTTSNALQDVEQTLLQ